VRSYERCSPLQGVFEKLNPQWETVAGMRLPRRVGEPATEWERAGSVCLCDVSALPKLGIAGARAAEWLQTQGVAVPNKIYEWRALHADAGLVIRLPLDEFFIEDDPEGRVIPILQANLAGGQAGCYPMERQDAALLVSGSAMLELMEQCCAVDFAREPEHAVMTRVAGVSCMVLCKRAVPALRLWCATGVAVYLWETLSEIARDLGGGPVGLDGVRCLL